MLVGVAGSGVRIVFVAPGVGWCGTWGTGSGGPMIAVGGRWGVVIGCGVVWLF